MTIPDPLLAELTDLDELRQTRDELRDLTARRDRLIRSLAARKANRERIAEAAGVTRQHTYAIAPAARG